MLLVNDDAVEKQVEKAREEIQTKFTNENNELKDKLQNCKTILKESINDNMKLKEKCEKYEKKELISEKTKNLPIVESRRVKEKLSKMTVDDIQKNYKTVLESVQDEIKEEQEKIQEEKNLEEAITEIMQEKQGDAPEKNGDSEGNGTESNPPAGQETQGTNDNEDNPPSEEETPVTESLARAYMQQWIDTLARFTPKN